MLSWAFYVIHNSRQAMDRYSRFLFSHLLSSIRCVLLTWNSSRVHHVLPARIQSNTCQFTVGSCLCVGLYCHCRCRVLRRPHWTSSSHQPVCRFPKKVNFEIFISSFSVLFGSGKITIRINWSGFPCSDVLTTVPLQAWWGTSFSSHPLMHHYRISPFISPHRTYDYPPIS